MKFKFLSAAIVAAIALPTAVAAQESVTEIVEQTVVSNDDAKGSDLSSNFRSNWFVSLGGGAQLFYGDHDRQAKFGDRLSPAIDVAIGKWISPVVGLRVMYSGFQAKGATQGGPYSTGVEVPGKGGHGYWLTKMKFNYFDIHADVMVDLCNLIGGYSASRPYSLALYAGAGYGRITSTPHKDAIMANAGLFNMFHVSKAVDINLDLRVGAFPDNFDGIEGNRAFDGVFTATAGVTYRFAPRGWKVKREVTTVVEYQYDNNAVNELRAQVAALVAENERLEAAAKKGQSVTHNTVEYTGGDYLIYFPINVSDLSLADRAQLEQCAAAINAAPKNEKFYVIGYADKATGTPAINEILSRARAESVRKCLVNEFNVDPKRLDLEWKGGVDNMFYNDPNLSRVVIIKPAQ